MSGVKRAQNRGDARVLYFVSVPIGNLEDMTPRARRLLADAVAVAAEDTRVTRRLLSALNIRAGGRLLSVRAHNEAAAAEKLFALVGAGQHAAYVTDAGTPGVSDPGAALARRARAAGLRAEAAPGASALTALLAVAGAPAGGVHFFAFPPRAAAARRAFLASLRRLSGCAVLFESPRRVAALLRDLAATLGGGRRAVLAREMTKLHEQIIDGDLTSLLAAVEDGRVPARGEFALMVETPGDAAAADADALFEALAAELPPRRAAAVTARLTGADSAALYRAHIARRGGRD